MYYNASSGEYFFQLPESHVSKRYIKMGVPATFIALIVGILAKDFQLTLVVLALILPIYILMYFILRSYTYVKLSSKRIKGVNTIGLSTEISWIESVKIDWDYKWSFRGQIMDGIVITAEKGKSIFIPKIIFETDSFKSAIKELAPSNHPLII